MRAWVDACVKSTGSSNMFKVGDKTFFWEESRTEHADGAITGRVHEMMDHGWCRGAGSFRIEPDGSVKRAPAFLKAVKVTQRTAGYGVGSGGF